jgi:predicted metal-dependent phosphoesterase TrpH
MATKQNVNEALDNIVMDTHVHSLASDGLWTPSEVVKFAKFKGLKVIAVADQDTNYGLPEAKNA